MGFLLKLLAYVAGLAAASWLLPGIRFNGPADGWVEVQEKVVPLLGVALILTLVNTFIRPVLNVLSFPLTVVTMGLFLFVVNGLMLMLTSRIADAFDLGFKVDGFFQAVLAAMIITVVGWIFEAAVGDE